MKFYKRWKGILVSLVLVGAIFVTWDVLFTRFGIWGFNPEYHASLVIFKLPIEEWLFFIVVPYASIFIHYSMEFVHPKVMLSDKITRILAIFLILALGVVAILYYNKVYTLTVSLVMIISLGLALLNKDKILNRYFISFLIIILPFLIFNGILTGTFIKDEVFWYNDSHNMGIRVFSMPVEDLVYGFSLILLDILCIQKVESILKPALADSIN